MEPKGKEEATEIEGTKFQIGKVILRVMKLCKEENNNEDFPLAVKNTLVPIHLSFSNRLLVFQPSPFLKTKMEAHPNQRKLRSVFFVF